uniref:Protein max n=1 Tax=Gadus morhua TaxID=8049 RepID=A0A8C5CF98_GADMO
MSDNDDIEVDSDEDSPRYHGVADKRAHHNALERKRRDHIKDSFHSLRDSVPALQGEKQQSIKQASRAQILDKATEYIQYMRRKNHTHQQDIDDLKKQNALLEQQGKSMGHAHNPLQPPTPRTTLLQPHCMSLVGVYFITHNRVCVCVCLCVCVCVCVCVSPPSARTGEGEGLHAAPAGQLLVPGQQPVHQPQGQRRVGLRRGLRLQLRVGRRGAPQPQEAPRRGQLRGPRDTLHPTTLSISPPPPPPSLPSLAGPAPEAPPKSAQFSSLQSNSIWKGSGSWPLVN